MEKSLALALVQQCVREGRFTFARDGHIETKHLTQEKFTKGQGIAALLSGTVTGEYEERDRLRVCGRTEGVRRDSRFIEDYIHVVVEYEWERGIQVVVITMYRPLRSEWETPYKRRRPTA